MRSPLPLLLFGAACSTGDPTKAVVQGTARSADGVPIAYDVRGAGSTALVFIHGWACDRSYWREQLDAFAKDYRVVALDLAGHGASGVERMTWSVAGLAGDVQAVVEALALERVILVGHSMGGRVALVAAARLPERVVGVVCADTLHNVEFQPPAQAVDEMAGRFEADFPGTMTEAVRTMFPAGADPALVESVIAKASAASRGAAVSLLRDFPNLKLKEILFAVRVPVRAINAAPRPGMGMATAVETNRKYADFDAVVMEGVGHFLMLERPAEFNARLREFLQQLDSR